MLAKRSPHVAARGDDVGRTTIVVFRVHLGPRGEEATRDVGVVYGIVERRALRYVTSVGIGSGGQEEHRNGGIPHVVEQRLLPLPVLQRVGAHGEEGGDDREVRASNRLPERRGLAAVSHGNDDVDVGPLRQRSVHLRFETELDRTHQRLDVLGRKSRC
jgi:hypothetical protein